MLYVSHVVVVWHVLASTLECTSVFDHFGVEVVEIFVWDDIRDYHEPVFVERANGRLQIARVKLAIIDLIL